MAADIGVARDTLYEWEKVHPEFADTLALARSHAQAWWEGLAEDAIDRLPREFNARLWSRIMSCRFPEDYRQQRTISLGQAPDLAPVTINVELSQEDADLQIIAERESG